MCVCVCVYSEKPLNILEMYGFKKKYKLIACIIWTSSKKQVKFELYNCDYFLIVPVHIHGATH